MKKVVARKMGLTTKELNKKYLVVWECLELLVLIQRKRQKK